jgi:hypothetical protein
MLNCTIFEHGELVQMIVGTRVETAGHLLHLMKKNRHQKKCGEIEVATALGVIALYNAVHLRWN